MVGGLVVVSFVVCFSVLLNIVATEGAALSATETITVAQEQAGSLATLVPRYLHAAHQHAEDRYRDAAMGVFGSDGGRNLLADSAWGAVARRLYDAETSGWDPARLLGTARNMRELDTADSVAEVMAWRIDVILAGTPEPPRTGQPHESPAAARIRLAGIAASILGPRSAERARNETAWPALIAALRRAENAGHDPARVLAEAASTHELRTARSISEVLAWRISRHLAAHPGPAAGPPTGPAQDQNLLPWIASPPHAQEAPNSATMPGYLTGAAALITARTSQFTDRAVRERPAWMSMLGQQPGEARTRQHWLRHVAIIAAYRDQHQVTTNDPRQVLGPYPEPGHAGHTAYWHAAESVLATRRLTGLDNTGRRHADQAQAQVAADIYRTLPGDERATIAAAVAVKSGALWFSDRSQADEHAATHPAYADYLIAAPLRAGAPHRARRRTHPRSSSGTP